MNKGQFFATIGLVGALGAGCSSAPGDAKQQGAVVGGATGAAVGAAVAKNNRALGAIIGGAVGAAGGYAIGKQTGHIDNKSGSSGAPASTESGTSTSNNTYSGPTADANKDGFVTLDEVVDMDKRGISDEEMIERLRATGQKFDLEDNHREYLRQRGVSETVISELPRLNRVTSGATTQSGDSVIGRERDSFR